VLLYECLVNPFAQRMRRGGVRIGQFATYFPMTLAESPQGLFNGRSDGLGSHVMTSRNSSLDENNLLDNALPTLGWLILAALVAVSAFLLAPLP